MSKEGWSSSFEDAKEQEGSWRDRAQTLCAGGPTCTFKGKEIPTSVTCSPKASITSKILADCLAYIDLIGVVTQNT